VAQVVFVGTYICTKDKVTQELWNSGNLSIRDSIECEGSCLNSLPGGN